MVSFTEHLLSMQTTQPYNAAVKHPFLCAAGEGTVSAELLSLWLSQDRIYAAHAYPRFIGSLIAKIPFSSHHELNSLQEREHKRILSCLSFALQNIVREADFFLDTSKDFKLDIICWKERPETRAYTAEMARVASHSTLQEGLIFLWAMEKVYLDAWTFVASIANKRTKAMLRDTPHGKALENFQDAWTNDEFVSFVNELAHIVDSLDISPGSEAWTKAEMIWDRVVELEVGFWPRIGEDRLDGAKKIQ